MPKAQGLGNTVLKDSDLKKLQALWNKRKPTAAPEEQPKQLVEELGVSLEKAEYTLNYIRTSLDSFADNPSAKDVLRQIPALLANLKNLADLLLMIGEAQTHGKVEHAYKLVYKIDDDYERGLITKASELRKRLGNIRTYLHNIEIVQDPFSYLNELKGEFDNIQKVTVTGHGADVPYFVTEAPIVIIVGNSVPRSVLDKLHASFGLKELMQGYFVIPKAKVLVVTRDAILPATMKKKDKKSFTVDMQAESIVKKINERSGFSGGKRIVLYHDVAMDLGNVYAVWCIPSNASDAVAELFNIVGQSGKAEMQIQ